MKAEVKQREAIRRLVDALRNLVPTETSSEEEVNRGTEKWERPGEKPVNKSAYGTGQRS